MRTRTPRKRTRVDEPSASALTAVAIMIFILAFAVYARADVPPVIPNSYVQDHANVLTPEDEAQIQNQLNQLKIKYNLEFAVATVTTTEPRVIEEYALEMARTYGIGAKDGEKRGILLLLAIKDRKWRFEISRHMEAVLTDGQSGSIGRTVLVPALKKAKDSSGYRDAILLTLGATEQQFVKNIEPEQKDAYVTPASSGSGILSLMLVILGFGGLLGGGYWIYSWRKGIREERLEEERRVERQRLREEREEETRKAREKAEAEEERERLEHEAWLKTPAGIAEMARRAELARINAERQRKIEAENARLRAEEKKRHEKWLLTPEGKADTARKLKEKKEKEARERREQEAERQREEARRKRQTKEDERRRQDSYSSGYSSSSSYGSSSSSSSYSSDSSSSSGSFSGGGDFGGGGSSGDW